MSEDFADGGYPSLDERIRLGWYDEPAGFVQDDWPNAEQAANVARNYEGAEAEWYWDKAGGKPVEDSLNTIRRELDRIARRIGGTSGGGDEFLNAMLRPVPAPTAATNAPARLPHPDDVIDKARAAAVLGCDVRTVERHISTGELESFKVGSLVRITGASLLRFVESQATGRKRRN